MRIEIRRRNERNKKRQASKNYWKNNKAGDAGGQESRAQPNDDQMIFTDYRKTQRVMARKGGKIEMHRCKPN